MSAYNIVIRPSRYAKAALILLAFMPALVLAFSPLTEFWLYIVAVASFTYYWQWFAQFQRLTVTATLALNLDGGLQWFGKIAGSGNLSAGGLICPYALKLCWLDNLHHRLHQRWVFVDQCSDEQFRALARAINQCNWSALSTRSV